MICIMTDKGWRPIAGIQSVLTTVGDGKAGRKQVNYQQPDIQLTKRSNKWIRPIKEASE